MSSKNLGFNKTGIPPHATTQLVDLKLDKASDALKKYLNGERKTRPTKKMLEVLESKGVISKSGAGYSQVGGGYSKVGAGYSQVGGKVSRINKAKKWTSFVKDDIIKDSIDLGSYGYDAYNKATNPLGHAMTKAITGGAAKKPSAWISFVKSYAQKNNMPYKEALKAASGPYKKLKSGAGYSSAN